MHTLNSRPENPKGAPLEILGSPLVKSSVRKQDKWDWKNGERQTICLSNAGEMTEMQGGDGHLGKVTSAKCSQYQRNELRGCNNSLVLPSAALRSSCQHKQFTSGTCCWEWAICSSLFLRHRFLVLGRFCCIAFWAFLQTYTTRKYLFHPVFWGQLGMTDGERALHCR